MRPLLVGAAAVGLALAAGARGPAAERLPAPPSLPKPSLPDAPPADPADRERVLAGLVDALGDEDPEVRQNVGFALSAFGRDAVAPLRAALKDASPLRRSGAAYALGVIGRPAGEALPDVVAALKDADRDVRRQAALAAGRLATATNGNPPAPVPTVPPPEPVPFTGAPR